MGHFFGLHGKEWIVEVNEFKAIRHFLSGSIQCQECWIGWRAPNPGWVKISIDGAMKASTGVALAGGLLGRIWGIGFGTLSPGLTVVP